MPSSNLPINRSKISLVSLDETITHNAGFTVPGRLPSYPACVLLHFPFPRNLTENHAPSPRW